jgi:hypothetical protein
MNQRVTWAVVAISLLLPLRALAQEPTKSLPTKSTDTTSLTAALVSQGSARDTQFLALIHARDSQWSIVQELRRIVSFHDSFRSQVSGMITQKNYLTSGEITGDIDTEEDHLATLGQAVASAADSSAIAALVTKFDNEYPLFDPNSDPVSKSVARVRQNSQITTPNNQSFLLFSSVSQVFSNVSAENREWYGRYQKIINDVGRASSASLLPSLPSLTSLPPQFKTLIGMPSYEGLTVDQVKTAIAKYRAALESARGEIAQWIKGSDPTARDDITKEVDQLGADLTASLAKTNSQFGELERSIAASAQSLYSDKVGGSSFLYLLAVFAGVFIVIMVGPKMYPEGVALNILKAEFLLQFSTVFVLIAAIIILGIGDLIDKQQVPVLLAGISGYVLGQLGKT